MNDPIDRLRAFSAAHQAAELPDVGRLRARATSRKWRRQGTVAGVTALCALAVAVGGTAGQQRLGVNASSTGPDASTATGGASPTPLAEESPSPGAEADPPEPEPTAEPTGQPEETPEPAEDDQRPEPGRPPTWERDPVGPAPYFGWRHVEDDAACHPSANDVNVTTVRVDEEFCYISYVDVLATTVRFGFAVCVEAEGTSYGYSFPTEQRAELTIFQGTSYAPAYTWSAHQTFAPGRQFGAVAAGHCVRYVWHLRVTDDLGRPLVAGRTYSVNMRWTANEARPHTGRLLFRAP